jgi:tetratricopeptide (TPR) repeat protein
VSIPRPGPDRVAPGPARDFLDALHDLYELAGRPGARMISTGIRRNKLPEPVSHETVSSALRGATVPSWAKVRSIVITLALMSDDSPDQGEILPLFRSLWLTVNSAGIHPEAASPGLADAELASVGMPVSDAVPRLSQPIELPRASVAAPVPAVPTALVAGVPERNPFFVGRELLLDAMRDRLETNTHSPLVLYGLSGVGKSQIAREYVERYAESYKAIWWVPSDSSASARRSLAALAERLDIPLQPSVGQTITGLIGSLESRAFPYVLVFDGVESADVDEREEVRRLIPSIGGHVIMTTRDPAWAHENSAMALEVPDFTRAEAIQFLRRRDAQLSSVEAGDLADALGLLPLALEQITALHLATEEAWADLIAKLSTPEANVLAAGQPSHYPHTVAASLRLALTQLADVNHMAVPLFELFAWFGPAPVSTTLLLGSRPEGLSPGLVRLLGDSYQLGRAIADMGRLGLIRLHAEAQRIEVQPLTRLALRDALGEEGRERARRHVHEILAAADPGWPDDLGVSELHREMAAHVLPSGLIESASPRARQAVLHQIRFRYVTGDFEDARLLAGAAVSSWRQPGSLGPDHEVVLQATREWANALRATGRYDEARRLTDEAMDRLRKNPAYDEDNPHTLAMATSYAADLRLAGRYAEALRMAEDTHRRHLARRADTDRRVVAAAHHNVAVSLRLIGSFQEAQAIDKGELERHREVEGSRHILSLLSANALAEDLYGLGRYRDVIDLLAPLLEVWRQVAPTHTGALLADRTVALARAALGDMARAMEALRDHHHGCIQSFGRDHEYSLAAAMSCANALRQVDLDEAYVYATVAERSYRHAFGPGNPLTLAAGVNLAAILRAKGERQRARRAATVARDGLKATLGEAHPFTIASTVGLASDHSLAGDHAGALALSAEAYDHARVVRGPTHPDTFAAGANLAIDRRVGADAAGADALVAEVLAGLRRTVGPDHPVLTAIASGQRVDIAIEPPST